jgi:hypothetical protein
MFERLRAHHALSWAAIGLAAIAAAVACLLPAFEVRLEASIGAGDTQRAFDYVRTVSIVGGSDFGLLVLAAALFLVAAAVTGIAIASRPWLVVASFVVAVALLLLIFDVEDNDRLRWPGRAGVIGYESPNGGLLLQPTLDDLKAEARSSPEAHEPGWELSGEDYYAAQGVEGWQLFLWSALLLGWLTAYRLARLHFRPWASVWIVIGSSAAIFAWIFIRALGNLE